MSEVEVLTKVCPECGEEKAASDFYRHRAAKDQLSWSCKVCKKAQVRATTERRKEEMGAEAWAERNRETTRRSRVRRGYDSERRYQKARSAAIADLIDRHRREYDRLFELRRYEADSAQSEAS